MRLFPQPLFAFFVLFGLGEVLGSSAIAGDDLNVRSSVPDYRPATVQIDDYLQSRKIAHSVENASADDKGPAVVSVKIFGVIPTARQDEICSSLAASTRKGRAHSVSVHFYELVFGSERGVTFQASRLPSGNGDVTFGQNFEGTYRLLRTVRL